MSDLNPCQAAGLAVMKSGKNVFLTGAAGTGKSHLVRHFLEGKSRSQWPILASTGAAALLVGGRTMHSFFGLGLADGAKEGVVARALAKQKVLVQLSYAKGILIDEISMIPGPVLEMAEEVARRARRRNEPWGGLQVIVVGDFRQLPPVSKGGNAKEWAFDSEVWTDSEFEPVILKTPMRAVDNDFLTVLNHIRGGVVSPLVTKFLNSRVTDILPHDFDGTRLFGRRGDVENYNLAKLAEVDGEEKVYKTVYWGIDEYHQKQIRKNAPLPEELRLKVGALIMFRRNDEDLRWVNGSLGYVTALGTASIGIELMTGEEVLLEEARFSIKDDDKERTELAFATNFPINLAWATTIHKSQGCTLDKMLVDLTELWEPGHAYVALSRVRGPDGLFISAWDPSSIKIDKAVTEFHKTILPKG